MSSGQERTEAATPRRRAKARAQGMIARSAAAAPAFALVAAVAPALAFAFNVGAWLNATRVAAGGAAFIGRHPEMGALTRVAHTVLLQSPAWRVATSAWLSALVAGLVASGTCGSLGFAPQALVPQLARILAPAGLRRLVSAENFWPAAAAVASVTLIAGLTLPLALSGVLALAHSSGAFAQAGIAAQILIGLWLRAAVALLIVAAIDIAVQRQRHSARLKMTHREVRDERAETEAKPEAKQRRRAVGMRRARGLRITAIRKATAVIANPTHVAVALRYAPPEIDVPTVVARGADLMAAVVRAAARSFDVPIIESPELARMLYARVEVDEPIPEECYGAVAAIFAWIRRTRGVLQRSDQEGP